MGAANSSLGHTKVLYATSKVLLGAKAKFLRRRPKVVVALDEISEICLPQSMFSVIVIPRYFADWTFSKFADAECSHEWFVCVSNAESLSKGQLATLTFICQSASQSPRLSRSSCKMRQSCNEWMFLYSTQSSANRQTEDLILSGRSFMKIRKRIGPKTDPWGTPDQSGTGSESWPSNTIAWRWVGLQTLWWFRLKDLSIDEMVGAWCFGCLSGPPGFTCWISFAPVFSLIYCWVLILALSPCYILIYMF